MGRHAARVQCPGRADARQGGGVLLVQNQRPDADDHRILGCRRRQVPARLLFDYASTGLTLRSHPVALLREQLGSMKLQTAAQLRDQPNGRLVRACGIVVMRQQPQTAKGVVFVTLEDETGSVNVIVWKSLREQQRSELLHSRLMAVYGVWQRDVESGGEVRHLIAKRLVDLTPMLGGLATQSREFH